MKEWRINLTYKLILFTIFLITPFILFVILNGINLIVQRFIVIYTLEILIFLLSYIVYEVRVRSFYNRLVQKTILLNDQYEIKNSKFFKFLGLDSFSSFEYFFNEELDKVFAELDYYKSGYFKNEEKKGTEIESNKIELDNKIKELEEIKKVEELERELLRRGNEFIKQFKKEVYADNTFFEELAFYLDKSFEIERLIVGQKMVEGYKVYNKLSDEIDESISYEMLGELDKGSYVSHRINKFFRYDVIIIIKIEEKNIGFLMFNVENKEYLNYKKVRDVIEKLFGVLLLIVDFHFKQKIKDEKIEKLSLDVKKLNSQLKETDANLDVHLEQMSNMYEEIVTLYEVGKKLGKIYEKQNIEKTILVVDDIKENRDLIVQILSFYGFKTLEASSGKEALELFDNQENQKIDLIFMDILMENLDGLQTIQIIRKKEKDFNIPIIALSANVFEEDKKQAINSGANDFLPKPVEEKDILLMLEKYLNIELIYDDKKDDLERNDISEELKNLPKEFFQKLNEKILLMDNEAILTLIKEYKLSFELQNHIENLVNEYKYQELMDLSKNQ